jgi:2-polyprenyl-3-methyl-5-hydroxy-6-metoxy-1,4-benzoquinol methylase
LSYEDYEVEKGWDDKAFGLFTEEDAAYFASEVKGLAPVGRDPLRVLEIGFGNGRFLGWAAAQRYTTAGLEINERLVARANAHGFNAASSLDGLADSAPKEFDLIAAFDVLEHIQRDHLVGFLRQLRGCCHPETRLVFRFPNGDNPFALYLQNGDWTHRTGIGSHMIAQLADLAGYELVAVRRRRTPFGGTSVARRLKLLFGWPLRVFFGTMIRYVFMGGVRVEFSADLVAVLKRRP